ncbi:MAG: hypothetical protein EBV05_02075, partial [Cyanobacteria bacterium WB6_1B_304]|nr:hypothetical protein [Cyanobacteria bacterium WB6_1B_304]
QGYQLEEEKSTWQLIELKEQFKLLKPKEGEKLAQWKAKFDLSRLENIKRGVVFDEHELIHFAMKQIEENYRYKFVTDYFKPFKVSKSDPIWRDLHTTYDEMMREFTSVVIREQESSKNVVQNAVFDLANTKSSQRGEKLSANSAIIDSKAPKSNKEKELIINAVKGDKAPTPKPYCRLGCKDKATGKTAQHYPENCYHPLMTDALRAAHKTERNAYVNGNKLEKQVKQIAGTSAAKKATGKTVAAATISNEKEEPTRDYRTFFYDEDDEPDPRITSLQIKSSRIATTSSKQTKSIFPRGMKLGQLDNGANVSVLDNHNDLTDVNTTNSVNIHGWNASTNSAVTVQGKLPGFGTVYVSENANDCIFSESQFLKNGWIQDTKYSTDPLTGINMPMEIHLRKAGPTGDETIIFKRDINYLWYAPYAEIIKHIKTTGECNLQPKIAAIITRSKRYQHTTALSANSGPTTPPVPVPTDAPSSQVDAGPTTTDDHEAHVDTFHIVSDR